MRKITLFIITNLFCLMTYSQVKIIDSFTNLDSLPIKIDNFWSDNNYIKFNSSTSTVYNIKSDIPMDYSGDYEESAIGIDYLRNYEYAVGDDNLKLIKTKIDFNSNKYYYITFGSIDGSSIGFTVFEAEAPFKIIGQIYAASLIIPGNGNFYSVDRYCENFETKRKYVIKNEKITEEKQPFYSVNIKSYALKQIAIYSEVEMINKIAIIPENDRVEIILCLDSNSRSDIYLLRTSFGLIGWTKLVVGQFQSVDVEGLYYNGD